jgi:predicted transposase YbfD/YdcC
VITIDAMGCQKKIAEQIKRQGGDYMFSLKGNQSNLHDAVKTFFTSSLAPAVASVSHEGEHGRIETRTIRAIADIA